jgi:hypothetical protein
VLVLVFAAVAFAWWVRSSLLERGEDRVEECVELGGVPQRYGDYGQYVNCLVFVEATQP